MNDPTGCRMRYKEKSVVTAMQRVVPGEYKAVAEIEHPVLSEAGFCFAEATVFTQALKRPILNVFLSEKPAERQEPLCSVIRGKGTWTFVVDPALGAGAAAVWLLTVVDFPERFLKPLCGACDGAGSIFMRPLKQGWLVAVQATFLKTIIKNGRRDT